jgi:hypothetical protein
MNKLKITFPNGSTTEVEPVKMWQPDDWVDDLKTKINKMTEDQLSAFWRWITLEYMNKASRK